MDHSPLFMAFAYLAGAVVMVPIAKRLGLGSVLGYLLAGVAIGPSALGIVGHEGHDVMHFAEFGVVMMLFLVGLELRPALLWELRRPILGLGGMQVVGTTLAAAGVAVALGVPGKTSVAIGMVVAMSSTAIVLQTLAEKSLLKTPGGQASFSILLFQDIAVIPILAIFPLLVPGGKVPSGGSGRPGWVQGLMVLGAVAGVVVLGRFVVRPAFRWLAETRLREIFTAAALLLVVGVALLMQQVELSPALGTFVAGVVLADSEYRHELESDVEPFKGLLLGVFFISVGAQIDFPFIASRPLPIAGLVVGAMALKLGVLYVVARVFGQERPARWLTAFALAQVGEFAFVLVSFGVQERVFSDEMAKLLIAVVALSMALTPALFMALDRVILPKLTQGAKREQDEVTHDGNAVIIAGHGRFGQIVGRVLRANNIGTTVLDLDPEMVDVLRRLGVKVFYGDASRPELLATAGCNDAKLFVLAIDDTEAAVRIAEHVHHTYPRLAILARARDRVHYYQLRKAGVKHVYRETFGSSFEMAIEALRVVGFRANTAHRVARRWRDHDARTVEELGELWGGDEKVYFAAARRAIEEAERLMREEDIPAAERDRAWDNESLREAARRSNESDASS
jgi:monovalent cation:proton antiporter-2 (CPA2) family protein